MQANNHRCLLVIAVLSCISEIIGFSGPLSNLDGEPHHIRPLDTTPRGQLETPIKTWSKSLVKREESYSPWMGRKKRSEYSPWAGKRALVSKVDIPKPKKFLPWVGKRSPENRSLAWDQMEQNQYNWDRMRRGGSGFNWDRLRRSDPESLEVAQYPISSLPMSHNNNVLERLRKSGAGYQWDRLRKRHGYQDDFATGVEF